MPRAGRARRTPVLVTALACLAVLPWAAWVAGGVGSAVNGRQGTYILFIPAAIAGLTSGMLLGRAMQQYADEMRHDSI